MTALSIRNMNRTMDEMEAIRDANTTAADEVFFYWRVLKKKNKKQVRDFHGTKAEAAETFQRLYDKNFVLRCSKIDHPSHIGKAVEAAYGQASWEFPWTDDDLGVSEEYKRTRPTQEEHPRPF